LIALHAGEPYRIARAFAVEAALYAAATAASGHKRSTELVERASEIARRIDSPHALGLAAWGAGATAYLEGRFRDGHVLNDKALAIYRDRCTGVAWEAASAQAFSLWSLHYLGEHAEISRRVPALIKQARDRGDLYDATNLRTSHTNIAWLVADDPDRAAAEAVDAIHEWSPKGFHLQHYYELHALAQCDLYRGQAAEAHERVIAGWGAMRRAFLLEIVAVRLEMHYLRARTALGTALAQSRDRGALLASAAEDAAQLRAAKMPWSTALAELVLAGVAHIDGDEKVARARFHDAADLLEAADMRLHAACARRRRGQLLGAEGTPLIAEAEEWMRAQTIVTPSRMCCLLVPAKAD
jgi:hypothetical protein